MYKFIVASFPLPFINAQNVYIFSVDRIFHLNFKSYFNKEIFNKFGIKGNFLKHHFLNKKKMQTE